VPYFGGKMLVGPIIANLLPPHGHYVEPYCGSLAVLLAKPPSAHETVNDLDAELMTFWRVLRDQPDELARVCALTPHSRAEHQGGVRDRYRRPRGCPARVHPAHPGPGGQAPQERLAALRCARAGHRYARLPRGLRGPDGSGRRAAGQRLARVEARARAHRQVTARTRVCCSTSTRRTSGHRGPSPSMATDTRCAMTSSTGSWLPLCTTAAPRSCSPATPPSCTTSSCTPGWDRHTLAASTGQGKAWANRTEVVWSNRPLGLTPTLFDVEG
jgi:DNA adenine methylase